MKSAKYFVIPEGPHDIDCLRREASLLGITDSPLSLPHEDAAACRCARSASCAGPSAEEKARAEARAERK